MDRFHKYGFYILEVSPGHGIDDVLDTINIDGVVVRHSVLLPHMAFIGIKADNRIMSYLEGLPYITVHKDNLVTVPNPFGYGWGIPHTEVLWSKSFNPVKMLIGGISDRLNIKSPIDKSNWHGTKEVYELLVPEGFGTGAGVKVAVLDTGVATFHRQLRSKDIDTASVLKGERYDLSGHGTHCITEILGNGYTSNGIECRGIAPDVKMLSVKTLFTPAGISRNSDVLKAVQIAYDWGADVISMSLGGSECSGGCKNCPTCRTIKAISEEGIIVCVAAGNEGPEPATIGCPGCCPEALTVGSISITDGAPAWFSSRGPVYDGAKQWVKPDVVSLGGGRSERGLRPDEFIYSGTFPGSMLDTSIDIMPNGFAPLHGTSQATPFVAGLVSLLLERGVINNVFELKNILSSMRKKNNDIGWGVLNLNDFVG